MLTLGPTFIKIGQVLSTRPDVVPEVYAEEFATLQDAVPPSPYSEMIPSLATDVGYHSYDEFDPDPIAGGSLAQVYEAVYDGTRVAVKVRRPGIKDRIDIDLRVIRRLLPVVTFVAPERYRFSLSNMADDFERIIQEELDFEREARMMDEIRDNFGDDSTTRIPQVYPDVSSKRVLTMEYIAGIKITDVDQLEVAGFDPKTIAHKVANAYFTMGLVHGVFHGDPHPGNLAVDDDGRIVFYDFGMSGRFTPAMQENVIQLYLAVVNRDVDTITDILIEIDALEPTVDRVKMAAMLRLMIDEFEGKGDVDWRDILTDVLTELRQFPFRLPPDIMLVIRVGTVSEGVLRELDPEFNFVQAAREFLRQHGFMERGARMMFDEMRTDVEASAKALVHIPPKLERALDTIIQNEGQSHRPTPDQVQLQAVAKPLAYALLAGFTILGASILSLVDLWYSTGAFIVAGLLLILFYRSMRAKST
ncbi:ABC1 kinase family protein [Haladaptatus sp. NG-SE-30]